MAVETDVSKYLQDDPSDLAKGFLIAMVLSLIAGILAWVACIGYFTVLLLPFFAGYICGYFIDDTGKSIIVSGFGSFTGALIGGFIATFGLDLLTYEYETATVIMTVFIIAIISLGAGAFGGYVRSSMEKPKVKSS